MAPRLVTFRQFPWVGGRNSSLDESTVPANQLVKADHVRFGVRGSRTKRDSINFNWDSATAGSDTILGLLDFHYGTTSRTHRILGINDAKEVYSYQSDGTRSSNLFAGTAWSSSITYTSMVVFENLAIIAADGSGNVLKKWTGSGNIADLGGTPPVASVVGTHLGRVFTNDKTNLDRLHYSSTGDAEEWNGAGDSGAIDIYSGDGDPEGITAIFSFKDQLFVGKSTKLYRVKGLTPETFHVELISDSLGVAGPNAWARIDQNDVFYVSRKGVHSIAATDKFGDTEETYVSYDIQDDFNENFPAARLKYSWLAYLPTENSIGFAVSDTRLNGTANTTIELFNIPLKSWYRWPNISCDALITVKDSDKERFYLGGSNSRVYKTFTASNQDTNNAGTQTGILYDLSTGLIFPDGDPNSEKLFTRVGIFFAPRGNSTITVTAKIDNKPTQTKTFAESSGDDLLGTTFILGSSLLGSDAVTGPYSRQIDGIGRGIKLTFAQTGTAEEIELQGFFIEYEPLTNGSAEVQGTSD